jgi:hypothetical protein
VRLSGERQGQVRPVEIDGGGRETPEDIAAVDRFVAFDAPGVEDQPVEQGKGRQGFVPVPQGVEEEEGGGDAFDLAPSARGDVERLGGEAVGLVVVAQVLVSWLVPYRTDPGGR